MVLASWWMILLLGAIVFGAVMIFRLRRKPNNLPKDNALNKPIAHSIRLTSLSTYSSLLVRYKMIVRITAGLFILLLISTLIMSTRPLAVTVEQPDIKNRDIMLCLDISGSMTSTDGNLLATFSELARKFDGERLGLTVFDSSASSVFPLTDDYEYIAEKLKSMSDKLNADTYSSDIYTGTNEGVGSSLIGDGLASCVMRFDNLDIKRSRSIILATDNYTNGEQIINLKEAGALAKKKSIRVYGINPFDFSSGSYTDGNSKEFHDIVLSTDGDYYKIDYEKRQDASLVGQIVARISQQEATRFKGPPRVVRNDVPFWFLVFGIIAATGLNIMLWRLRR